MVTEEGSYLKFIDSCITQLKVQGPSRTCNESKEEAKKKVPGAAQRLSQRLLDGESGKGVMSEAVPRVMLSVLSLPVLSVWAR